MISWRKEKVRAQADVLMKEIDSMRDILSRKYQVSKYECVLEHNCKYKEDMCIKKVGYSLYCIKYRFLRKAYEGHKFISI